MLQAGTIIEKVDFFRQRLMSSRTSGPYFKVLYTKDDPLNNAPYCPVCEIMGEIYVIDMSITRIIPKRFLPTNKYTILGEEVDLPIKLENHLNPDDIKLFLAIGDFAYRGATRDCWHRLNKIVLATEYKSWYGMRKKIVEKALEIFTPRNTYQVGNLHIQIGEPIYINEEVRELFGPWQVAFYRSYFHLFNHAIITKEVACGVPLDNKLLIPVLTDKLIIKSIDHPYYCYFSTVPYSVLFSHPFPTQDID